VSAGSGAMPTQPYIPLTMSVSRFGKSRGRGASPSYRDRAVYALDAQLASLASSGDDSAFTTLVTRFQPAVFRWALMFASDPDEAEDITQEVFVRTYRQLGEYRSDGPLDAWLYRITRRAATQMGMKPVSVRANLFKARKAIRESLLATHPSYRELSR